MIVHFRAIDSAHDVRELIGGLDAAAAAPELIPVDTPSTARCHVCSGTIGETTWVMEFTDAAEGLPTHLGCHRVRLGASPPEIAFAMKIGFWAMMLIQHEKYVKWLPEFAFAWVEACGGTAGTIIATSEIPEWNAEGTIDSANELVDFLRYLYLFEREGPKFAFQNMTVPAIDEWLSWKEYKRDVFMPAYAKLERLTDRKTLLPAEDVLLRTGGACALCCGAIDRDKGAGDLGLAKDHIHPFSKGGTDDLENLQPMHHFCNGAITSLGPGEIPLSLSLGRLIINSSDAPWLDPLLTTYAKHLADTRKRASKRKNPS